MRWDGRLLGLESFRGVSEFSDPVLRTVVLFLPISLLALPLCTSDDGGPGPCLNLDFSLCNQEPKETFLLGKKNQEPHRTTASLIWKQAPCHEKHSPGRATAARMGETHRQDRHGTSATSCTVTGSPPARRGPGSSGATQGLSSRCLTCAETCGRGECAGSQVLLELSVEMTAGAQRTAHWKQAGGLPAPPGKLPLSCS